MYENSQLQRRRAPNNANNGFGAPQQRDSYVVHSSQTREDLNQVRRVGVIHELQMRHYWQSQYKVLY